MINLIVGFIILLGSLWLLTIFVSSIGKEIIENKYWRDFWDDVFDYAMSSAVLFIFIIILTSLIASVVAALLLIFNVIQL